MEERRKETSVKAGTAGLVVRAVALALVGAAIVVAPAAARVFSGNGKANRVLGTGGADLIRLGAGNDRAHGGGGADSIVGGAGRDQLTGGAGKDRLRGGAGRDHLIGGAGKDRLRGGAADDRLNAADGRADLAVNGGGGRNACRVDQADVAVARNCSTLTVVPASPGGGGGGGGTGGGGAAPAPAAPGVMGLGLIDAGGLSCPSSLPLCPFELTGTGADGLLGTVTGGGGVLPGLDAGLSVAGDGWTATGLYGCTGDGFLRVTIGTEHLDLAVSCTA
jgi:hypothetical protein